MDTYYVRWRGRASGPFTKEDLISQAQSGQLTKHHSISADETRWTPAGDVDWLLKPKVTPPVARPPAGEPPVAASAVSRPDASRTAEPEPDQWAELDEAILADSAQTAPEEELELGEYRLQHAGESWWLALGVFFLVSCSIPIFSAKAKSLWLWDLFSESGTAWIGVWAFYMLVVGIALPIVGTTVAGLAQAISIFVMGFLGISAPLLYLIVTSGPGEAGRALVGAESVLGWIAMTALLLTLVGNSIRKEYQHSLLGRLLGGISAGVMLLAILLGFLLQLSFSSFLPADFPERLRTAVTMMTVLGVLGRLGLAVTGILVIVNIGNHGSVSAVSFAASLIARISLAVISAVVLMLPMVLVPLLDDLHLGVEGSLRNTIVLWGALLSLRVLGAIGGLFIMMGISLANFFKITVLRDSPGVT